MPDHAILVIDDESRAMRFYWDALKESGFKVVSCSHGAAASSEYRRDHFDLFIIDMMVPWEPPLKANSTQSGLVREYSEPTPSDPSPHDPAANVGQRLHAQIRAEISEKVPIIILTNLSAESVSRLFATDDCAIVCHKPDTKPWGLVEIARDWIAHHPFPLPISTEYTDGTTYYVQEIAGEKRIAVRFAEWNDPENIVFDIEWRQARYGANFQAKVDMPETRRWLRALHRFNRYELSTEPTVEGVLFLGGDTESWLDDLLLEAAPWNVHGANPRTLRWVGKALVARIVQERLARALPPAFMLHVGLAERFFLRIGFEPMRSGSRLYFITEERAMKLLEEMTL